ncbi:TPR-like protein [Panus rudis PR-1116 ss-1]|nr:TPR-like protein [Panus rudis PR-1116 ss-1]
MSFQTVEQALLTGEWTDKIQSTSVAVELAQKVVQGKFREALTSSHARNLFSIQIDSGIEDRGLGEWFKFDIPSGEQDAAEQELLRLTLAIACLHAFLQANWTGPDLDFGPLDVISVPEKISQSVTEDVLRQKSIAELAKGGEPAYHLAAVPIYLRLAILLFDLPYQHCSSATWWRLRVARVHEQVLDEPVAVPPDVISSCDPLTSDLAYGPDLSGRLFLEEGLLEHAVSNDRHASELFVRAARETKLEYELTGALGKRTKFQQTDITQLILLAESREREGDKDASKDATKDNASPSTDDSNLPETLALNDDTLLEHTQFTASSSVGTNERLRQLDPSAQPALHPLDQCILLALCLNIKNTSPVHGLTAEQMSAYVSRVISHPRNWSVHTMALLLRSRLEANRTRTVERAVLQLQALVDQMPTADATVSERLMYIHDLLLPSKWEMEKELAKRFLSLGVVKSALEIFERLEMWEEVVLCYSSLEKRDNAIQLVRDLLEGRKAEADAVISRNKATANERRQTLDAAREAKLWCLLGDLEPDHALEHYNRAWTVSRETSGRAMRSLGGYYFARGDYPNTISCLRKAVAINPLLARSWFVLGCAYVRTEDWEGAREAFTRCVTIDDEDGESWNNLASVYLRMGDLKEDSKSIAEDQTETTSDETKETVPFSNKMLAFHALKRGLKFCYDNWRMWSNYMIVAVDVGELSEACRALSRVVEERAAKDGAACVDEDVLDRLVDAVTRAPSNSDEAVEGDGNASSNPNKGHGLYRRVQDLFDRVILPRVSSPRIFRARARLYTWQGQWEDAVNAYLNAYRGGVAGTMEKGETDVERFREGAREVEEILDVLRNFGPRVEGLKWRLQARSIVRTFMGKTRDFEDEPEYARLSELLEEIRKED